jgi:Tfp pilus assembly protein PilO
MFAENVANKLIGLLVTVAILAAVYFFAIKPVLDTTNDAFDSADGITEEIQQSFDESGFDSFNANSINIDDKSSKQAEKLLNCVQKVQPNTTKMQKCVERFQ